MLTFLKKWNSKLLGRQRVDEIVSEFTKIICKFEGRAEVLKDEILEHQGAINEREQAKRVAQQELDRAHAYIERFEKLFVL